jgi:hypothetical protein
LAGTGGPGSARIDCAVAADTFADGTAAAVSSGGAMKDAIEKN